MTVNERLSALGLLDRFHCAAKERARDNMISILVECAMTQEQSEETTDTILANPKYYGF